MKTDVKDINAIKKLVSIEIESDIVESAVEDAFLEIAKTASVPGFRVGKAPIDMIRNRFAKEAIKRATDDLINEYSHKAVSENKLNIISAAVVKDVEFKEDGSFYFKIEVEIRPTVTVGNYKGMKLLRSKSEASDKDVENALEYIRNQHAKYFDVKILRPVQDGDYVQCDISSTMDGQPFEEQKDCLISLKKDQTRLEFYENLLNANIGQVRQFDITTTDKDDVDGKYVGKKVNYVVKINAIKYKELPELNDQFVSDVLKVESLDKVKENVRTMIDRSYKQQSYADMKHQVMEKLLEVGDFDLPESLVNNQLNYLVERSKEDLEQKGSAREDIDKAEKDIREKLVPLAKKQVKTMFILDEIAKLENISVSEEELEHEVKHMAQYYKKSEDEMKKEISENDLKGTIKMDIREKKTIDFIIDKASVEDKAVKS